MKDKHLIGDHSKICVYCGQYNLDVIIRDMKNTSCTRPNILKLDNLRITNKILEEGKYKLFTAIPITSGSSKMSPYGDGSSCGSGSTSTHIEYILQKKSDD